MPFCRKRRNSLSAQNKLTPSNPTSTKGLSQAEVPPACTVEYDYVLDERENYFAQPQRDSSRPGEHPYAVLKGKESSIVPGTNIATKIQKCLPTLEEDGYIDMTGRNVCKEYKDDCKSGHKNVQDEREDNYTLP
ncbi:hypothetical protein DPMN_082232 [Dreissena polymorpha]|uniref:Uncharacterized protein n=1 Tax=Dreissena polymorpha TaxID=45954 RepID=A0A9D4B9Y4_DREPO|nr:hypothetical protein DPMN_082232 [Dreissena polymorpha]